ncbi:hypothetical protein [Roseibacillus persicicus]|uniref:Uncharacterized protein n=1 Tax=Roseibacillus persicicus TaxID=454148 RepID=A0A918TH01_9BACT|nr:hypothetical protein [Roseibacillus persicicus]MDQ8191843.1 hypothetical protein [Roseibacillus persicicus]GHC44836.1 hypothetical protein GCM10007100_07660 [Roseibacillus persicicus]
MTIRPQLPTVLATLLGMATLASGQTGDLRGELNRLRRENVNLSESLVAANKRADESTAKLNDIKLRLEAMGSGLLDGGDDRLVKAVSDLEVMARKLKEMEEAALALSASTQNYLSTAIAADPEARVEVETRLRALDTVIGLREAPRKDRQMGNLQQAEVVSVDSESGVVVVNVGQKESAVVGMAFEVYRNDSKVAEALVAQTRNDVSALLVTNLENEENPVRRGDRVSFKRSN